MGGLISRCCCKKSSAQAEYKKLDQPVGAGDLEAGGANADDDEEWDDFGDAPPRPGAGVSVGVPEEPEPEPEPDPFADFGMAPKIEKTKKHVAQSMWAQPSAPTCSRFAMDASDSSVGGAWGDGDDLGDTLGVNERRRVAEQRREERRGRRQQQNEAGAREKPRLAATKVAE